jgi:hypothetical protein
MQPVDMALWLLTDVCAAAALVRLFLSRLQGRYPAFAWMLSVILLRDFTLMFCLRDVLIAPGMHLYTLAWMATLIPALFTQAAAGIECYQRLAALYPKIGRFAPRLFGAGMVLSALICLAGLRTETRHISGAEATFRVSVLVLRWQTGLEFGALVLGATFLLSFPPPMRRRPANVVRHTSLLGMYFGAYAITTWVKNVMPLGDAIWIERGLFLLASGLYLTWAMRMRSSGETTERWPGLNEDILEYIRRREEVARELINSLARSAGHD